MNINKKKAPLSLIFGCISILIIFIWLASELIVEKSFLWEINNFLRLTLPSFLASILNLILSIALFVLPGILGLLGLILGIKSLKVNKSSMGMLGIILCIASILLWAYEIFSIWAHSQA
jgi:hypothetical protein